MKIAAVVILYHPQHNTILNIKTYYDYVDKIYVFDNSETNSLIEAELSKLSKTEFHQNFKNEGIAKRLNEACEKALNDGFDWILTMDQDSNFSSETISYYFNCFMNYSIKENVAMFGTNSSRNTNMKRADCTPVEVQSLITSGSLLNLSLFKKIGNFDELLFIDLVDTEYCIRAKIKSYSIIRFSNIHLVHELGKQVYNSSIKSLFTIKKNKEVHSPLRCYYMYRNLLYIEKKYKNSDSVILRKLRKDVVSRIKICAFYGREAYKILKYVNAGRLDYKKEQMGKIKKKPGKDLDK